MFFVKYKLKHFYHPRTTLFVGLISQVRFGASVLGSLRTGIRRTLYDLYCPYFSSEVMVKLIVRVGGGAHRDTYITWTNRSTLILAVL